jgi:hypothetical protein
MKCSAKRSQTCSSGFSSLIAADGGPTAISKAKVAVLNIGISTLNLLANLDHPAGGQKPILYSWFFVTLQCQRAITWLAAAAGQRIRIAHPERIAAEFMAGKMQSRYVL